MLRTIFAAVMLAALIRAQDATPDAEKRAEAIPIPAERHEGISRDLLTVKHLEAERERADKEVSRAQAKLQEVTVAYDMAVRAWLEKLVALQKEFQADGCALNYNKQWINCQKPKDEPKPAKRP